MTEPTILTAAILGVVEGLTEFLPVSSTGHLIVAASLLDYTGDKAKLFEIVIQAGAILAVCWEFRRKFIDVASKLFSDRGALRRDCSGVTPRGNVSSSAIIIRTHNHRPTNKREPVFRSNH